MNLLRNTFFLLLGGLFACSGGSTELQPQTPTVATSSQQVFHRCKEKISASYPWLKETYDISQSICHRIAPPAGYERAEAAEQSQAEWLRYLPLKPGKPAVMHFDGSEKWNQDAHYAVVNIDVGKRDLQQCADAVMRLQAEFLRSQKKYEQIHFNFTSGDRIDYSRWMKGERPGVTGNKVYWKGGNAVGDSYTSFRKYMDMIFSYAGTASLSRELASVEDLNEIQPGDLFIQGGHPGHAVVVVDVAIHAETGKKVFMLCQSYMPAQDMHVLKNPSQVNSPWYSVDFEGELETPEWTFDRGDLMRFKTN